MLQYLFTALAGIALGIVAMRLWQARGAEASAPTQSIAEPAVNGVAVAPAIGKFSPRQILIGAGVLAVVAIAVIAMRPEDEAGIAPTTPGNAAGAPGKPLDDVDTMMQRLADRLEKAPDGEGFRMLAWSYVMTGHPDKAIAPYKRALALLPNQSNVHAGYGEALVGVAKGTVSQEAKDAFDRAIKADPSEPRARYFEALWLAQHGQEKEALDKWIVLANDGPADAPWQADLRRQIGETSTKLGVDSSSRLSRVAAVSTGAIIAGAPPIVPDAAVKSAAALPAGDRQVMIDQMVEGLAKKLAANPKDADGWIRLLRSRMVLGQGVQAARDLAGARRGLAGSPTDLARMLAAAKENGVPGS
jgi:cytochrome c-type biogenesis protein CcmH